MFCSNKNYVQFKLDRQDKPLNHFLSQSFNKENFLYPQQNQSQSNFCTGHEVHQEIFRTQETYVLNKSMNSSSNNFFDTKSNTKIFSEDARISDKFSKSQDISCKHEKFEKYVRTFCKECGEFLPKSGAKVHREQMFKERIDSHPDEIYNIMLSCEKKNRIYIQGSAFLKYRKFLVDWICKVATDLDLSSDTIHLAFSYIDTILSQIEIPKNALQLVTLCCLVLATKFSEKEDKVPSYKDLFELCRGTYSLEVFKKSEKFILDKLDWNLKTTTPFQFVQFYLSKGCVFSNDFSVIRNIDPKLLRYLRKYSEFFLDLSLHDYGLNIYKSHILACAALIGARKAVGLFPIWNSDLEELSGVTWKDIEPCFVSLYESFEVNYPDIANKANSYVEKYQRRNDVIELEQSYAALSIDSIENTSFHQKDVRENYCESKSAKKKERPFFTFTHETKRFKKNTDWTFRGESEKLDNSQSICINLIKKVSNNVMNIENTDDNYLQNKVKRNLVF